MGIRKGGDWKRGGHEWEKPTGDEKGQNEGRKPLEKAQRSTDTTKGEIDGAKFTFRTSTPLAWTESQREEKKHQLDGANICEDIR